MTVQAQIQTNIRHMTTLEKEIAHYFLTLDDVQQNLSAQVISETLHISKAALTRFAKKCGFNGYREFIFHLAQESDPAQEGSVSNGQAQHGSFTKRVLSDYESVNRLGRNLISEEQLQAVAQMIEEADRVYFFGKGSSGLVARELKLRMMRLGVVCEALTERDSFAWTTGILNEKCLVLAFSLSGETRSVIESLYQARRKGAKTVLLTANQVLPDDFDETIHLAALRKMDYGQGISPQIPMLMMVDLIYSHFLEINRPRKEKIFNSYWENEAIGMDR